MSEDIAIVGMAVHVPGATTLDGYWQNLKTGTRSIRRLDEDALIAAGEDPAKMRRANYVPAAAVLDDFDHFDADFFGFSPKEAAILDPQHRQFLEVAWEALETAGHPPESVPGRIGVYAGCGMGSYFYFNICSNPDMVDDVGMFLLRHTGNDKDFMSTRVSHVFDLKGPSINLQTACSTSLVAVHYAAQAILSGECDMALAGGSTIELPHGRGYLFQENEILSPDGECHAFDHRAEGTVFGSGAGAVVLRRLSDAIADGDHIWAVLKGSAINNDGADKAGYLAPSVSGQAEAIASAHRAARVNADSIGYVECHGTGTYLGDPIEVAALTEAFAQTTDRLDFCKIGSVKTNIGHLDTAAGVASLVKAGLALHHRQIPPSLGYEVPNPVIDFDDSPFRVADTLTDWPAGDAPRRAGVNSLGVGGTNAHAVLEEPPARAASGESDWPFQILTVSGRSRAALDANTAALAAHLRARPEQPLADVAFTLKEGRRAFDHRRTVVAETHEEAAALLDSGDPYRVFTHTSLGPDPEVVFMFPGGGAQYPGMARDLYETEPVFAEWMDRGLDHLQTRVDHDIRALWLPDGDIEAAAQALQKPSAQLPLIMITEYALAQLWQSWGVTPAALVGHSMGENTAACLAGVMSFTDCIDLVLLRGQLFDRIAPGGMLSVPLSLADLKPHLTDDLDIASLNAPDLTAVSGPQAALDALQAKLAVDEIEAQRIQIDIAAHSRMLDPILDEFRACLAAMDLSAPTLPILSNRTGVELTPEQATDPDYWVAHLRNTVHFADCIATLAETPNRVFLEVGPGKALSSLAQMNAGVAPNQVLSSLRHPDQGIADDLYFLGIIGRLWATGVSADWSQIWGDAQRHRVPLPTYAFQRSRYFIEPGERAARDVVPVLTRHDDIADFGYRPVWRKRAAPCDLDLAFEPDDAPRHDWLIFADEAGLSDTVVAKLRAMGQGVVEVRSGDAFARVSDSVFTLAPEQGRGGYDALIGDLAERGALPTRIAHFWGVTPDETHRPGSNFFDRNQEHGFYSLLYLSQALGDHDLDGVHLTAVTNGAAQVRDEVLHWPEKAMIAGPVGVIPRELPGLSMTSVDVDLPHDPGRTPDPVEALANDLLDDMFADPGNRSVALRAGTRFELAHARALLDPAESVFRQGGTYILTGGLGGIGMTVAERLLADHGANVVLITRAAIPEQADWPAHLRRFGPNDRTSRHIRRIERLRDLGGQVMVASADVCDQPAMEAVVQAARDAFGRIDGVLHGAGHIDDAPFLSKTVTDVEDVLSPKVHGLRVLDRLFPDGSIELLVLFSSTSTAIRAAGQVDYVAANEYLNAYAKSRRGGATKVRAIDWGVWAEVGMAAEAIAEAADPDPAEPLDLPLLTGAQFDAEGRRVLSGRLATEQWLLDDHRTGEGQALLPGTGHLELAAQAMAAQGHGDGFEIRDLTFFRPLGVADDAPRDIRTRLTPDATGYGFETLGAVKVDGRAGFTVAAQGRLVPGAGAAPDFDLNAIAARTDAVLHEAGVPLNSPQEAHLNFGPRWRVLDEMRLGDGEGLAYLSLPDVAQGDIAAGWLLHPALMDLATGWAMRLVPGYGAQHLWVPVSYRRVRVFAPLPAKIVSWVRLASSSDGFCTFDVVIAAADGTVCVAVEGFAMSRLEAQAGFATDATVAARDVEFDDAPKAARSPAEERLADMVAQGIAPGEGFDALNRALALDLPQVIVSSLDLPALVAQAGAETAKPAEGQKFDRPDVGIDYVAPETPIEQALATLWQDLLGVSQVGIHDSFFDLGGHSLIAVRLFAAIRKAYDVDFPISILFEAPTIAKCAALIAARTGNIDTADADTPKPAADQAPASFTHLVPMNEGKSGAAPFFMVAGMFGNVLNLRHLGNLVGQDRPFYGLQARGLMGEAEPHRTIPEAAAAYIAELKTVQPEGPYHLGGFSGGGITAYEMAQQLRAHGDAVAQVVLLDTPLPVRPDLTLRDKALIKLREVQRKGPGYVGEWLRDKARYRAALAELAEDEGQLHDRAIEAAFLDAVANYHPQPYDGAVTLFRPPLDLYYKVTNGRWVSRAREYVYHDNEWTQFIPNLVVEEVPGDHDSMVLEPNVRVLARRIRASLNTGAPDTKTAKPVAPLWITATAAE